MRLQYEELMLRLQELIESSCTDAEIRDVMEDVQSFDLAEALEELPEAQAIRLLAVLEPSGAAEVLEHLEFAQQYRLLDHMDQAAAAAIMECMSSDAVTDLVGAIHPKQAQHLLGLLSDEYELTIRKMLRYPENTAGRLVAIDYISVRQNMTVEQVLKHIRKVGREAETIAYIYVVDPAGRLVGVMSVRDLLMQEPYARVETFMNESVVSVPATMDQEAVAQVVAQYDLVAVPVLDEQGRLVGIITIDDLVDVIRDEATEDIQKLGGSEPLTESYFSTPVRTLVNKRIWWILVLFLAEAYTGTVLRHFENTLAQVVSLTFFIPLLIGTGGNTGSQVVTTLVRGLAVGEVKFSDMGRVLLREMSVGIIIGTIMSLATLLRAYTLGVGPQLGPVVALTTLFIVLWASMVAAVLPLILHRLKVDPAVVSGPFISTVVDGTGLFMYFSIAQMMLGIQ